MGGGASKAAAINQEKEKAAREIAAAREAAAAQENRVDELQSQLESERARSAGLEIQIKQLEAGARHPAAAPCPLHARRVRLLSPPLRESCADADAQSVWETQGSMTPSSTWKMRRP
jgi:hypothetical protein